MVPPLADEAGAVGTQLAKGSFPEVYELSEEFEVVDDDEFIGTSTSSDGHIIVREEIMDQELDNFIDDILHEDVKFQVSPKPERLVF